MIELRINDLKSWWDLLKISFQKLTYIVLWITVFTIPIQKHFIVPGIGSINKIAGIILVITAICTVLSRNKIKKVNLFYIFSSLFIFLNLCSYFWAEVPIDAINKSILFCQVIFLAWAIYEFTGEERQLNNLFKAYVLGCTVIAFQTLYQYSTGMFSITSTRFFIEGYNPNALSITWALGLPMALYLVFNRGKFFILYLPIATFAILLSGSRTGLLLLSFAAVSMIWFLFKQRVRFRKLILGILIVIGFTSVKMIPEGQLLRLGTLNSELTEGTLNGRTEIWRAGLETFSDKPILGVGSGSFLEASVENSDTGIAASAHSSYLSVLVENGMLGFMVFASMLMTLVVMGFRISKNNQYRWLSFTLITMWLILSFASHAEVQKYTWIIFGMIVSSYYISKKPIDGGEGALSPSKKKRRKKFIRKRLVW